MKKILAICLLGIAFTGCHHNLPPTHRQTFLLTGMTESEVIAMTGDMEKIIRKEIKDAKEIELVFWRPIDNGKSVLVKFNITDSRRVETSHTRKFRLEEIGR